MHIVKRELRSNLKSLVIWSVIMIIFIVLMVSEFSAYYDNPDMADILDSMPEGLMKAFSLEGSNLTTPSGFIGVASVYFYLMLSFFAILLGSNIIAKEERDKTAEYFLSMPISRKEVIISKWIASIIHCLLITSVTGVTLLLSMMPYDLTGDFYKFIGLLLLALFMLEMIFLSLGMLIASSFKRYNHSSKLSAVLVMVFYILSVLSTLTDKLSFINYVSPFKYFETSQFMVTLALPMKFMVLSVGIVFFSMIATLIIYPKRDLNL